LPNVFFKTDSSSLPTKTPVLDPVKIVRRGFKTRSGIFKIMVAKRTVGKSGVENIHVKR